MKTLFFTFALLLRISTVSAQDQWQSPELAWLKEVLPIAASFSEKQGTPPVYIGYGVTAEGETPEIAGYVYASPDLPPEEIGFSGPVDLLIGLDLEGRITGVKVLHYLESYKYVRGDFIGDAGFVEQFQGKSFEDGFIVNEDVDGMSRATVTSWAIARTLRKSARLVAKAYLSDAPTMAQTSVMTDDVLSNSSSKLSESDQIGWSSLFPYAAVLAIFLGILNWPRIKRRLQ